MSTTFGVSIPNQKELLEVAFRGAGIRWKEPEFATMFSDETEVIPIDNGPQGINTIGDIKKAITEQEAEKEKEPSHRISITLNIKTGADMHDIKNAITKGLYKGLDTTGNYISRPKDVDILAIEIKDWKSLK